MSNPEPGKELDSKFRVWSYVWAWFKLTITGTKGFIGDAGLILGLIFAWLHARWPNEVEAVVKRMIPASAGYEDAVAFAPLYLAGFYLCLRALAAPVWLAQKAHVAAEDRRRQIQAELSVERKAAAETIESLQRRIGQLETPAPRVLVRATGDSQGPFALKNVGPVEAHNVKLGNLESQTDFVEFEVIDPLESGGEERIPQFRVLRREGPNTDVFRIAHFYSFSDSLDESFEDLARRAGYGIDREPTHREMGLAMALGPKKFPGCRLLRSDRAATFSDNV